MKWDQVGQVEHGISTALPQGVSVGKHAPVYTKKAAAELSTAFGVNLHVYFTMLTVKKIGSFKHLTCWVSRVFFFILPTHFLS